MTDEPEQPDVVDPPSETEHVAPHDAPVPERFSQFMSEGWTAPTGALPEQAPVAPFAAARRNALMDAFADDIVVIPAGNYKVRSNDTDYPFRPNSDFFWLTGCHEPDSVLVLDSPARICTLYLAGRSDRSTPQFYRDRRYGELWVGPRAGVAETEAALAIACRPLTDLAGALAAVDVARVRVLTSFDTTIDHRFPTDDAFAARTSELAEKLAELRLEKDSYEIECLREAMAATARGFEDCVRELAVATKTARGERWIEGTFWRRSRLEGNDVGYGSIVACGHHATTLHWIHNDGPVRKGDLALLDMGVEATSIYTADITRTIPISGTYTPLQRKIYNAVLHAQKEALAQVKPGAKFLDPHNAAMRVLAGYLVEWGILQCSIEETMEPSNGFHRRFTLHGVSHMLGIDVHDCAAARDNLYFNGTLRESMVLTVEPGLYFQLDDETVPPEYRGIGVRIEDDVLVTADGFEVLSHHLPTDPDDIEQWMAGLA